MAATRRRRLVDRDDDPHRQVSTGRSHQHDEQIRISVVSRLKYWARPPHTPATWRLLRLRSGLRVGHGAAFRDGCLSPGRPVLVRLVRWRGPIPTMDRRPSAVRTAPCHHPAKPRRLAPGAVPRPAGGSRLRGSGGDRPGSSGTVACLPWPSGTRSWARHAGCRRPRRLGGSWERWVRPCRGVGLPRRIPFVRRTPAAGAGPGGDRLFIPTLTARACGARRLLAAVAGVGANRLIIETRPSTPPWPAWVVSARTYLDLGRVGYRAWDTGGRPLQSWPATRVRSPLTPRVLLFAGTCPPASGQNHMPDLTEPPQTCWHLIRQGVGRAAVVHLSAGPAPVGVPGGWCSEGWVPGRR